MNRMDFEKLVNGTLNECIGIMGKKGNDYAGNEDVLRNFKLNAERLGLRPEQIWAVYFMKHIDAILTYVSDQRIQSEPIDGRIQDSINYLLLFQAMVTEE